MNKVDLFIQDDSVDYETKKDYLKTRIEIIETLKNFDLTENLSFNEDLIINKVDLESVLENFDKEKIKKLLLYYYCGYTFHVISKVYNVTRFAISKDVDLVLHMITLESINYKKN